MTQSLAATTSPSEASQTSTRSTQSTDQAQTESAASANVAPEPTAANESNSLANKQKTAGLKGAQPGQALPGERGSESGTTRGRWARARVVGITSDGKLIFRLPSGRTAIVAPDSDQEEFAPQRQRRLQMERGRSVSPNAAAALSARVHRNLISRRHPIVSHRSADAPASFAASSMIFSESRFSKIMLAPLRREAENDRLRRWPAQVPQIP